MGIRKFIGDKRFYAMLMAIAVPMVVQNGITNFVSLLDNIMVGRLGTEPMSGVAIANQLIFVFNLCIFGGISGAGIFCAQFFGSGNFDGIRRTFRFKMIVCVVVTAVSYTHLLSGMSEESRDRLMQDKAAMEKIIGDAQTYTTLC